MLAYYLSAAPSAPAVREQTLSYPLREKQLQSVFLYMLTELKGEPLPVDARWEAERRFAVINRTKMSLSGAGAPVETLREILGQMGFSLQIPDLSAVNRALVALQEERSRIKAGDFDNFNPPQKYKIGKAPADITVEGDHYTLQVTPINARVNLNLTDEKSLEDYLLYLGLLEKQAEALARQIVDYRDEDRSPLGENSEGPFQGDSRFSITPANRAIRHFEELALLPGIDAAMVDFLRDHFTLIGTDARLNLQYNPPEALAAYADMTPQQVAMALDYERNKNDPLYTQTLQTLLGLEGADKWTSHVTEEAKDSEPVLLKLSGRSLILNAVYMPEEHKIMDVYQE